MLYFLMLIGLNNCPPQIVRCAPYGWQPLEPFVANSDLNTEALKRTKIQETVSENSVRNDLLKALGFDETDVRVDPKIADSFIVAPVVK